MVTKKEDIQVRGQFDTITLKKIGKGALITGFYAVAVFILSATNGMDFGNSLVNALVVQLVPTLLNTLKEWYNGEVLKK